MERYRCPFVYANGKRCDGEVLRLKAYGSRREIRKIRFWCAEKSDHAGFPGGSPEAKRRMEFYPDKVPGDLLPLLDRLRWSGDEFWTN